jgi:SpoIID/LytB domain protein
VWVAAATVMWLPTSGAVASTSALPAGSVTVQMRGNGHGHGMSQYGARGAALQGLSATQILAFYYQGAKLTTLGASTIRVRISGTGTTTTVLAASDLHVTGISGALVATGVSKFRLVASGTGLALQKLLGSTWTATATPHLPSTAQFSRTSGAGIRLYLADGTSTTYRGVLTAVRSGSGVVTVNRVSLDGYTAGVTPRESPASWPANAVHAQAIAARSYGRYAVEHPSGGAYDICDTTQCQVYGGMTHYNSSGTVLWTEDLDALSGNSNMVLRYNGQTIFAQFSASDGGWTVDGGQPYLVAKQDPYDSAASGDPYLSWSRTVSVSSIASYYGLAKATAIEFTGRDGHGTWGGRVTSAYVDGVDSQGNSKRVATTGFGLQAAMGLPTTWFWIQPNQMPRGHIDSFVAAAPHVVEISGWTFDPDHLEKPGRLVLTIDHAAQPAQSTTLARPDVKTAFSTTTNVLGFSARFTVSPGWHTACLYGVDQDGLGQRQIMCVAVRMVDPLGSVDSVTLSGLHTVKVAGWSFDPSHDANPGKIQPYLDRNPLAASATTLQRLDVQRVYHTMGSTFGYALSLTVPGGDHTVCVYGIDQDGAGSVPLRCQSITVPQDPLGHVEQVHHVAAGYQLEGWTFDPDQNGGSTKIQVWIGDVLASTISATALRADVQSAYDLANAAVGFSATVPASTAKHTIKVVGVNTGAGANTVLVNGYI